jgi:hypothetical protein
LISYIRNATPLAVRTRLTSSEFLLQSAIQQHAFPVRLSGFYCCCRRHGQHSQSHSYQWLGQHAFRSPLHQSHSGSYCLECWSCSLFGDWVSPFSFRLVWSPVEKCTRTAHAVPSSFVSSEANIRSRKNTLAHRRARRSGQHTAVSCAMQHS